MQIEDYLVLEKEYAQLLCGGAVHMWGGFENGSLVETNGAMRIFPGWSRSNDASMKLAIAEGIWAKTWPRGTNKPEEEVEAQFLFNSQFPTVYTKLSDHIDKEFAYRYAILMAAILKFKKTKGIKS